MNESVTILLNGMPLAEFWVWYAVALAGAFVYLMSKVYHAINRDPDTPNTFSWRHLSRGLIKFIVAMILIPWGVIYYSDIFPILVDMVTMDSLLPEGVQLNAEINGFSAFLVGLGIDYGVHKVLKVAKQVKKNESKRQV